MSELFHDLPGRQTEEGPPRRRRGRSGAAKAIVLVLSLALVAGAVVLGVQWIKPMVDDWRASDDYEGPGTGSVQVQIEQGQTGSQIGRTLADQGVVKTVEAFTKASMENPDASGIQPGTYTLQREMKAADAINMLLSRESRISWRITLPEGWRATEALARISSVTGHSVESLRAAGKDASLALPAGAQGNLEGYLFPETYDINPGSSPVQVLKPMVDAHKQAMEEAGVVPARQREVLTLASIVESESGRPEDTPKIARVFQNRLDDDMPLQSDATVAYANNKPVTITTTPEERESDSPYNTYKFPGLPPGPVNSPGAEAIRAAANPEPGPWLYFVAVNPTTRETRFANTLSEHNKNVELFRQWLRENPQDQQGG